MTHIMLLPFYDSKKKYEIGLDESGRGPMFGRMYASAVVLPKENFFFEKCFRGGKRTNHHPFTTYDCGTWR